MTGESVRQRKAELSSSTIMAFITFGLTGIRNIYLSRYLGPAEYAINALSTQLLVVFSFFDLGLFQALKGELPSATIDSVEQALVQRAVRVRRVAAGAAAALTLFMCTWTSSSPAEGPSLAWLAAGVIFQAQSIAALRMVIYVARGDQRRSVQFVLVGTATNFIVTFLLVGQLGTFIIVISPLLGVVAGLLFDNFRHRVDAISRPHRFGKVTYRESPEARRTRWNTWSSQMLGTLVSVVDINLGLALLSANDAGIFSFAMNAVAVVPVLPLLVSGYTVPFLASKKVAVDLELLRATLARTQRIVAVANGLVSSVVALSLVLVTQLWLPNYRDSNGPMWVLLIGTLLYTNCFYTSSLPMRLRTQGVIWRIQIVSLLAQGIHVLTLAMMHRLTLPGLASTLLTKALAYCILHTLAVMKMTKADTRWAMMVLLSGLVSVVPTGVIGLFAQSGDILTAVLVLGVNTLATLVLIRKWYGGWMLKLAGLDSQDEPAC